MTKGPFLIAHIVRRSPAFDIAEQRPCPLCTVEENEIYKHMINPPGPHRIGDCDACDSLGYEWVIPTSGHRAFPYWHVALENIDDQYDLKLDGSGISDYTTGPPSPPPNWPDHYSANDDLFRKKKTSTLAEALSLHFAPSAPIRRRV